MDIKKEGWPIGFSIATGDRYRMKYHFPIWRIYAADFEENEVALSRVNDSHVRWVGSVQELQKSFVRVKGLTP